MHISIPGNNSEGNEANWPIIRLSEAVDLGSAVGPEAEHLAKLCHNTRGLQTQNYNKCPSRLERKGGSAVQPGDTDDEQMSWDQCQESEEERGGCVCVDERRSGPSAL